MPASCRNTPKSLNKNKVDKMDIMDIMDYEHLVA